MSGEKNQPDPDDQEESPGPAGSSDPKKKVPGGDGGGIEGQVKVPGVTARVPDSVGRGVLSTGAIIMNGPHAFVFDFLQQMGVPAHLVSRVVMPHPVVPRFIQALEQNLANYQQRFGPPPQLPRSEQAVKRPSIEEVYDNIKIPDAEMTGHFAEGVMIRHSAAEFCFDFVTQFFPHAAVSSRIFMSAPHVPPLLRAIKENYDRLQSPPPADASPPADEPPTDEPPTDEPGDRQT